MPMCPTWMANSCSVIPIARRPLGTLHEDGALVFREIDVDRELLVGFGRRLAPSLRERVIPEVTVIVLLPPRPRPRPPRDGQRCDQAARAESVGAGSASAAVHARTCFLAS